jgi:hypothetical protein
VTTWASLAGVGPTTLNLPPCIRQYAEIDTHDRSEVSTPNMSDAFFCQTNDGWQWVRKGPNASERGTLAECVSWLLARELSLPIPVGGAVLNHSQDGRVWMSSFVMGSTWMPRLAYELSNDGDLGRVLAFDVWVDNGDRHERNIILEPQPYDLVRFCAIDFDGAGVGGFQAWDGDLAIEPHAPTQCPADPWFSRFDWPDLESAVHSAESDIQALIGRTQTLERIAAEALKTARGADPADDIVDLLVRYLAWRGRCIHSMAQTYWQKAVLGG